MLRSLFLLLSLFAVSLLFGQDELTLNLLSSYRKNILDQNAVTVMAYSPDQEELYFANAATNKIEVLNISDPGAPDLVGAIEIGSFRGQVQDLDFLDGVLVVAARSMEDDGTGSVLFFDRERRLLREVFLPLAPVSITFSKDGDKILTANEGGYASDGMPGTSGSVSMIDLEHGMDVASVVDLDFKTLIAGKDYLQNTGLFGGNASRDQQTSLHPSRVSTTPVDSLVVVVFQKNNAYAILDLEKVEIVQLLPFPLKDFSSGAGNVAQVLLNQGDGSWPTLGRPVYGGGQPEIELGGFSGLHFDGATDRFYAISGRGPVGDAISKDSVDQAETPVDLRPFKLPEEGSWLSVFSVDPDAGGVREIRQVMLRRPFMSLDGSIVDTLPITGKANVIGYDEIPVTYADDFTAYRKRDFTIGSRAYMELPYDPYGADFGGITRGPSGGIWICDKYRPSLYHFDSTGLLRERFVPIGSFELGVIPLYPGIYGKETLPENYSSRQSNGGFEALTYDPVSDLFYAFMRLPLNNFDPETGNGSGLIRILGIDPISGRAVAEYIYRLRTGGNPGAQNEIGGAVCTGPGEFLVLESGRPVSERSDKYIFAINLLGASNVIDFPEARTVFDPERPSPTLEMLTPDQFAEFGLRPVLKKEVVNLSTLGYPGLARPEGITLLPGGELVLVNDNEFGMAGDENWLSFLTFANNYGIDASDRDNRINIANHRVFGLLQPSDVTSFEDKDRWLILTGNTGKPSPEGSLRVGAATLDENRFVAADSLQKEGALGRLNISNEYGDLDGDGDFDELYAFGGRSFSILSAGGSVLFDSGDDLERITADRYPLNFNSGNQSGLSFDSQSDDQGPTPGAVEVGQIGEIRFAFIGLRQIGGVMVYNISDPERPTFTAYLNNRDFSENGVPAAESDLGVSDVLFIEPAKSPNQTGLLVVANSISGSISFYGTETVTSSADLHGYFPGEPWFIYPNPASAFIQSNERSDFQIFNAFGVKLGEFLGVREIYIGHLVPGTYFVRNLNTNQVKSFVKGS